MSIRPASTCARSLRVLLLSLAAAVVVSVCFAPAVAEAQTTKIAVIDLRRSVLETEDGLRVQAKLKQLFDSRQVELDNKQKAFQKAKSDFDKQAKAAKLSKAELQRRYETLQKQAIELQAIAVEYQREMTRQETELTTPILQRLLSQIQRLASSEGYVMVVDKAAVPYFRSDLDITDRVIQMYNAGGATPAGTVPAAKPKPAAKPTAPRPKTR